jgi:thioester reductase-like protein
VGYTARQAVPAVHLRQKLAELLPASHLPQFLVQLPEMPVGANGKTDRREVARRILESLDRLSSAQSASSSSQEVILQSFREILGSSEIDATTHFFSQGGDSLAAVHLSLALQDRLGCNLSAGMIYRFPTPAQLHGALMGTGYSKSHDLDLPDIVFSNPLPPRQLSRCVLLTGATGFIGIHILERLLTESDVEVVLLVRDLKGSAAAERLAARFHAAFGGRELPAERLSIVTGDLSKHALGVSKPEWTRLSEHVDEIIHCGAMVNFLGDHDSLFDANVLGTAELIRLCSEGQGKRLHHISSLAVRRIEAAERSGPSDIATSTAHGYELTKYLADQLVRRAQQQGLSARIYRLDDVLPALGSGHPNGRSLLHLFLKTCLRYRMVVRQSGTIGLLPVDIFAEWMCSFTGGADRFERLPASVNVIAVRHVEFEEFVRFVAGDAGHTLVAVDYATFLARLARDQDKDAVLLRSMLPNGASHQALFNFLPPSPDDHSALSLLPWRSRFSLELVDFMPFANFVMRSMVDWPSPRSERMA